MMKNENMLLRKSYLNGNEISQYEYVKGTWDSDKYYYEELFRLVEKEHKKFFRQLKNHSELKDELKEIEKYLLSNFALSIYSRIQSDKIYLTYIDKKFNEFDEIKIKTFTSLINEELLIANVVIASLTSNSRELRKLRDHPLFQGRQRKKEDTLLYDEIVDERDRLIKIGKTGHGCSVAQAVRNVSKKKNKTLNKKKIKNITENVKNYEITKRKK